MTRSRHSKLLAPAAALAVALSAVRVAATEPVVRDAVQYRDISGNSIASLVDSLGRMSVGDTEGKRFYGNTRWELGWNVRVESDGATCRVSSADVDLTVTTSLPRWNPPPRAPTDLVRRWNAFSKALAAHEDGHRDIAIEAARKISDRLAEMPTSPDCEKLKRSINLVANGLLRTYKTKEQRYDETTEHGRRQGAVFP